MWVGGLVFVGVALMQVQFPEPQRWMYAAPLWVLIALVAVLHVRAGLAALVLCVIPAGYFMLAMGIGPAWLAFGVTEVGGGLALIIGGWGLPHGILDRWADRAGVGVLAESRNIHYKDDKEAS